MRAFTTSCRAEKHAVPRQGDRRRDYAGAGRRLALADVPAEPAASLLYGRVGGRQCVSQRLGEGLPCRTDGMSRCTMFGEPS
jgi:hypothetical protein